MKTKRLLFYLPLLLALMLGAVGCSSDDEEIVAEPFSANDINVFLIQSDNGKTSYGTVYKNGEGYKPPRGYIGSLITYEGDTIYYMSFGTKIKGSDVFDGLDIGFASDEPMNFSDLKVGDTFDTTQFQAEASITPTWTETIMKTVFAKGGNVTVVDRKRVDDKNYIVLKIINLRFDGYTVNGTVEYELYEYYY